MNKIISIAMIMINLFFASPEAYAEGNSQQTRQQPLPQRQQPMQLRSQYEFQSQSLTQMVDLPEVPQYAGQMSFVAGTLFPNAKSGASLTMKLRAVEYPEQVKDWYQASLQQSGWKLEKLMCNEHTVAAWKGKRLFQVVITPPSNARFRCDLLMRYRSCN